MSFFTTNVFDLFRSKRYRLSGLVRKLQSHRRVYACNAEGSGEYLRCYPSLVLPRRPSVILPVL